MTTIERKMKLVKTLRENKKLAELVKKIQILNSDRKNNITEIIQGLDLPLNYHLFIMGNFSDLMSISIK